LKLQCDGTLSKYAFNFNLRRYSVLYSRFYGGFISGIFIMYWVQTVPVGCG
jgi:hypothetical protein